MKPLTAICCTVYFHNKCILICLKITATKNNNEICKSYFKNDQFLLKTDRILPAYVFVDIQHVYINFSQPDFCECHKKPKRLTSTVIPERDAVVALGQMWALKTVLVFKSRLQLRSRSQ